MIIDNESCTNVANTSLAEKISLLNLKYPRLYKIEWLNKCEKIK